ncbi:ABC protein, sub ABCG [Tyrophagus putrescentiae]|nr:ABC protein, sub ABCG [Tyrophagus putrescentiae]
MKSALSVLDELNLPDTADTKVNYLSGREKKRLAVGLELVAFEMPNFICLDELVSGLDSHSAATVISTLRKLTDAHPVTIITVIHQPSTQMLYSFDQLFVLSNTGHCVFSDPPTSISEHLSLALKNRIITIEGQHAH